MSTSPEQVLNELASAVEESEKLINEIGQMLSEVSLSKMDRDLAEYCKLFLEEERGKNIAKFHTLKNLIYYRNIKQGGSDAKH